MKIKPHTHYRMRSGNTARIDTIDGAEPNPVYGSCNCEPDGDHWMQFSWSSDGTSKNYEDEGKPTQWDLMEEI